MRFFAVGKNLVFATHFVGIIMSLTCAALGNERPNILWITCEDMGPRLGCYGDTTIPTPNIDRLAREGVRYTNMYGVYGVCAPNRHCIIMGMYPTTTGGTHMRTSSRSSSADKIASRAYKNIPLYEATPPPRAKCFPEYLRKAGYFCTNNSKTDYQFKVPVTVWDVNSKKAHWRDRPNNEQPFFSVFNFTVTHESGTFKQRSPRVTDPDSIALPPYYPDTPLVRRDVARHYDNIAALDKKVERVINELNEDGLQDTTIVIFFSDHGDGLPRAKRWVYDSGIHVPLLVRWPDRKSAGSTNNQLVSFVDLAPTMLSLAGVVVPRHMQGQVFLGAKKTPPRDYIYAVRDRMDSSAETIRAVRDQRYKYIKNYRPELPYVGHIPYRNRAAIMQEILRLEREGKLGPDQWQLQSKTKPTEEFYDCQSDPHEIKNLVDDPKYALKIQTFRDAHEKWNQDFVDLGRLPEPELVKKLWPPTGKQPTTDKPAFLMDQSKDKLTMVSIHSQTEGASIGYRIGPSKRWLLYTDPVMVRGGEKFVAQAHRIGFKPSENVKFEVPDFSEAK